MSCIRATLSLVVVLRGIISLAVMFEIRSCMAFEDDNPIQKMHSYVLATGLSTFGHIQVPCTQTPVSGDASTDHPKSVFRNMATFRWKRVIWKR